VYAILAHLDGCQILAHFLKINTPHLERRRERSHGSGDLATRGVSH